MNTNEFNKIAGNTTVKELRNKVETEHNELYPKEIDIINFFNNEGIDFTKEIGHSLDLRCYNFLTKANRLAILEAIKKLYDNRIEHVFFHPYFNEEVEKYEKEYIESNPELINLRFFSKVAEIFINIDTLNKNIDDYNNWTVRDILSSEFFTKYGFKIEKKKEQNPDEVIDKEHPFPKLELFALIATFVCVIANIVLGIFLLRGTVIFTTSLILPLILEIFSVFATNVISSKLKRKFS